MLVSNQGNFLQNILHIRIQSKSQYRKIEILSCILPDHYGIMVVSTTAKKIKGHRLIEAEQHTTESKLGEGRNQKGKFKIHRI